MKAERRHFAILFFVAPHMAWAQNEALISCKSVASEKNQEYFISLTSVGNITVEERQSGEVIMYMPITMAAQLQQNDDKGLQLTGALKSMGMVYKEQKIAVDYETGLGQVSEQPLAAGNPPLKLKLQDCKKL